jgi:hypothetical protein
MLRLPSSPGHASEAALEDLKLSTPDLFDGNYFPDDDKTDGN